MTNQITKTQMNELTRPEVAWLAGIYEGEGSCTITKGRAIRVEIVMTDEDVVRRVCTLTGLGSVRSLPQRGENYKGAFRWSIGSSEAVDFLTAILPWLGQRRAERAQEAIQNWTTNRKQSTVGDKECINGHAYNAPGNRRTTYGTCHMCNLEQSRKYRAKKKALLTTGNMSS